MTLYVETGYVNENYVTSGLFIDWANKIIHVPRTHLLLVQSSPTEVRELDLNIFRLELKALEAGITGITFLDTHQHNPPVTVGGVTLARVVEIINEYTITFEDGQYAVNISGGNSNVGDVVNQNQVSVRSANSAGLTYSKEIEDLSFLDGRIWIDTENGNSGTQYPRGTPADPCLSYKDAEDIAENRGLPHRFWLSGLQLLGLHANDEIEQSDWLGLSPTLSTLVFNGVNTTNYTIRRCSVTGLCRGTFSLQDGVLSNVVDFSGDASNCGIDGTITLPSGVSPEMITIHNCFSIVPGTGTPVLDCNHATGLQAQFRGYNGGIHIKNYSSVDNAMTIDLGSGHAKLDSTCTAGTIVVRGTGKVTDNSGPGCTVVQNVAPVWSVEEKDATLNALGGIADAITLLQKYEENRSVIDKDNKTLTIYDDDEVTPILSFSLRNSEGDPSVDEVAERLPIYIPVTPTPTVTPTSTMTPTPAPTVTPTPSDDGVGGDGLFSTEFSAEFE
jgi:hypothetical protein